MLKVFRAGGRGAGECMVLQVLCDLLTLGLRNIHAAVYFLHFFFPVRGYFSPVSF